MLGNVGLGCHAPYARRVITPRKLRSPLHEARTGDALQPDDSARLWHGTRQPPASHRGSRGRARQGRGLTANDVKRRLREAAKTFWAWDANQPNPLAKGYGNGWPDIVRDAAEAYGWTPELYKPAP